MYKLILSDLDETLLVNHHVPSFNIAAIQKARQQQIKFVVATGRAYDMIGDILKEIGTYDMENEYSICFNGALIVENKNCRILSFKSISFDYVKKLFMEAKKFNVCVLIFTLDMCYIFNANSDEIERKTTQKARFKIMDDWNIDFLENQNIAKIIYQNTDITYLKEIGKELAGYTNNRVSVSYSSNRYLEFNALNVNKGNALCYLANYLKVDIGNTVAIGDNYNDVEMLEKAGLGACVCSGADVAKDVADYITELDYDQGAVKEVIEKFVLNK